ncbi:hypothetical protein D9757_010651 [Collybiopsis confluens]|uniref:G domain-containing protein n=1 Tax=Collybiopsis confluens TaxID=2823264 RepID=A0A8H5LS78_9AGAR|nr:hypothetical protein D9757_010651 [Collybiopsis confluens]
MPCWIPSCNQPSTSKAPKDSSDVVIAVMGSTGSGKSSFIKLLSGSDSVKTGDSLDSDTIEVQRVDFVDKETGRKVVLVDTPGFDDSRSGMTDTEVLRSITKFLLDEYDNKRKLNGIIYFHSIANTRFSGQSVRNLNLFKNLCGTATYNNVVILTTFWDGKSDGDKILEEREMELKTNFCLTLVEGGAVFRRHDREKPSAKSDAHKVLEYIFTLAPTDVQITKEIRVDGKTLEETSAGASHKAEIAMLVASHTAEVAKLRAEMESEKGDNDEMMREFIKERDKVQVILDRLEKDRAALAKGLAEEKKAQKALSDMIQQSKNDRIQQDQAWNKRFNDQVTGHTNDLRDIEKRFEEREQQRQQQEWKSLFEQERRAKEEAEERLRKTRGKSWRKLGLELAEDICCLPNFIGKPIFGGLGIGADLITCYSRSRRANA